VAGPTLTQRVEELTKEIQRLQTALGQLQTVTDLKLRVLEDDASERKRVEEQLREQIADLQQKNAALEERSRHQEKTSDRGWQLWLAALGFGFGLISLLVTAALQLKK
jgi:hypothetical protein